MLPGRTENSVSVLIAVTCFGTAGEAASLYIMYMNYYFYNIIYIRLRTVGTRQLGRSGSAKPMR